MLKTICQGKGLNMRFEEVAVSLSGKTVLLYGEYSKVFPFILSLVKMNKDSTLLFLDSFNMRTMVKEAYSFSPQDLSRVIFSKFEGLVELDKALEQSETMLINKGSFKLLIAGSLPDMYLREISLHDSSSHSNILYLLNKILAFFSFLSKKYSCIGILIGPGEGLNGSVNIPAKRIFLYWVDYVLELRKCGFGGTLGELTGKTGVKTRLCMPLEGFKETGEILECSENACPRNV
ncbi:MAG: hypothetical protein QXI42_08305 [Thermoproteota archaeon]|nr:hypothetical protein [Candidatus Brockarchaeota archaeon]